LRISLEDNVNTEGNIIAYKNKLCPSSIYSAPQKLNENISMRKSKAKRTPDVFLKYKKEKSAEFMRFDGHHYARKRRCKLVTDYYRGKVYDIGNQIVLRPEFVIKYNFFVYNPVMERIMNVLYCNNERNEMVKMLPSSEYQGFMADKEGNHYYIIKFSTKKNFEMFIFSILLQADLEKKSIAKFESTFKRENYCSSEVVISAISADDTTL